MTRDFKDQIADSGLRYASKQSGTPFSAPAGRTMSCFVCGKHVPRSALHAFRLAGATRYRCSACLPARAKTEAE